MRRQVSNVSRRNVAWQLNVQHVATLKRKTHKISLRWCICRVHLFWESRLTPSLCRSVPSIRYYYLRSLHSKWVVPFLWGRRRCFVFCRRSAVLCWSTLLFVALFLSGVALACRCRSALVYVNVCNYLKTYSGRQNFTSATDQSCSVVQLRKSPYLVAAIIKARK